MTYDVRVTVVNYVFHGKMYTDSVENHMPVTNRLGILLNGQLVDLDHVDALVARHSPQGYTVVVHLKEAVDVNAMFAKQFQDFSINDVSGVSWCDLNNRRVLDMISTSKIIVIIYLRAMFLSVNYKPLFFEPR